MITAVIFDMDGVIIDSESVWDEARRELAEENDGTWTQSATQDMMGMSSPEWSAYMANEVGVKLAPEAISKATVAKMIEHYDKKLPLIDGAVEAVRRMGGEWPIGIASSSNRELIDLVLEKTGLDELVKCSVSSEEVAKGKPSPDVYLEACKQMDVDPKDCAAIEDSSNGIKAAYSAGLKVIAVPRPDFPPSKEAIDLVTAVCESISDLTPETISEN